jgi:hypothetical protein
MKLKVLQAFHDKDSNELYEIGKELEVTEKRGKELLAHPLSLVSQIQEPKKTSNTKATKTKTTEEK